MIFLAQEMATVGGKTRHMVLPQWTLHSIIVATHCFRGVGCFLVLMWTSKTTPHSKLYICLNLLLPRLHRLRFGVLTHKFITLKHLAILPDRALFLVKKQNALIQIEETDFGVAYPNKHSALYQTINKRLIFEGDIL